MLAPKFSKKVIRIVDCVAGCITLIKFNIDLTGWFRVCDIRLFKIQNTNIQE